MKISKIKKGKNKGTLTFNDKYKTLSKYRKEKPNRFYNKKRFLSLLDLAEAKKMEAIFNSRVKRGELTRGNFGFHYVCACGIEGCVNYTECNT